jgi:hypothetical protein
MKTNSRKDPLQELKTKSDLNKRTQSSEPGINQANMNTQIQWHLKTHITHEIHNKITTDPRRSPLSLPHLIIVMKFEFLTYIL